HLATGEHRERLGLCMVDGQELRAQLVAVELDQPGEAQPQIVTLEARGESAIGGVVGGRWRADLESADLRQPVDRRCGGRQRRQWLLDMIDSGHGVPPARPRY